MSVLFFLFDSFHSIYGTGKFFIFIRNCTCVFVWKEIIPGIDHFSAKMERTNWKRFLFRSMILCMCMFHPFESFIQNWVSLWWGPFSNAKMMGNVKSQQTITATSSNWNNKLCNNKSKNQLENFLHIQFVYWCHFFLKRKYSIDSMCLFWCDSLYLVNWRIS